MPSTNGHGFEPERVALYMRVSSEEQRERQTIQTQQEFLSEYARVMELEVVDTYPDDGVLGKIPLEERSSDLSSSSWRRTTSLRRSAWRFGAPTGL
jgi:hypothetical protein